MWTGWKPTSPSGLRCSITSKSNTPPDWPGARLWVSKGRRRRREKKIKKGNYCNLKHKKQLSNDQMQPDSWINTFTLGPVLLILCARANWSLALEKIVLSVLRVIRLHDFCSLPCCICISGTSFLVVHNEGKAGAFRVQNNPETELELCFC